MESFALAIPGCFDEGWGEKVWKEVFEASDDGRPPPPMLQADDLFASLALLDVTDLATSYLHPATSHP
jgi:hypothetical protein